MSITADPTPGADELRKLYDVNINDPVLRPSATQLTKKMIDEHYRVRIHSKRLLMSLYKAFERLKRRGESPGMWTKKTGKTSWLAQARKPGEKVNPLRDIERDYASSPGYHYGKWKGLATKLSREGGVVVADEDSAKRVVASFRHYFSDEAESAEPQMEAVAEDGKQWRVFLPGSATAGA